MREDGVEEGSETRVPLLKSPHTAEENNEGLKKRVWVETTKLWEIVGPAIFSRITTYSMLIITQAFAGHLGDLELAAISIVNNVLVGFNFGLLLGMASALETLCGQAFGAKKYYMLGVYMQRSWIVLSFCCLLLLPTYLLATPVLKFLGQPDDIAELSGVVAVWVIPLHFAFALSFPLQRFLQCQLKNQVTAVASAVALVVHILVSWLFVDGLKLGVVGTMATISISWWVNVLILLGYAVCGGCPLTWTGFSSEAFTGLWEFLKLSASSGVMLCLENWYYRILIIMTGNLQNARIAVDSLSICMSINGWEMMIPLAFFAGTGVRVANELGAAFTVLLNSIQPVLSGVAVGSGWQSYVAYINLGCYYCIGVPLGFIMGWVFKLGVMGIWAGMIFGGTAVQTLILGFITIRCDWEKEAQKASARVNKWSNTIK
ncbi:Protein DETOXIFICATION 27 [Cardamine amara subsp. amara]|uniref:Protein DETOXIFICATION 27 n=1 Tax=Cardamine amara subsp. amara TaxID=228776 RepID=A0ABD0ZP31_CARAN